MATIRETITFNFDLSCEEIKKLQDRLDNVELWHSLVIGPVTGEHTRCVRLTCDKTDFNYFDNFLFTTLKG